jgi:hypothetical protein
MALTRRGGTGGCCNDCSDVHNGDERQPCGCMGCLPQWICLIIELDGSNDSEFTECCKFMYAKTPLICGTDNYETVQVGCGNVGLVVSFAIDNSGGDCCFVVTVTSAIEEVVYRVCADPYTGRPSVGLDDYLSIAVQTYPAIQATGTISVAGMSGVSNSGQYNGTEVDPYTGEISVVCPKCSPIRLNPRKEPVPDPPIEPCDRTSLTIATKTAVRNFGEDWQQQIADGNLFASEFCWFVSPCKCIPDKVCVDYVFSEDCATAGINLKRFSLDLIDCMYGPEVFTARRGAYGTDTITIWGELNQFCEIVWTVETDFGGGTFTKALTRIDLDPDLSKRCDVSLAETSVPNTGLDGNLDDTILVSEQCVCVAKDDDLCPRSCEDLRAPPNADPTCYLAVLTATVISGGCDFEDFAFPMHFNAYEDHPAITSDSLPVPDSCQHYHSYDINVRSSYVNFPQCDTLGTTPPSDGGYLSTATRFALYFPTLCDSRQPGEYQDTNPGLYRLVYEIQTSCNLSTTTISGTLSPSSSSCDPFELIFDVPFNDITDCTCNCSSFQLKITL